MCKASTVLESFKSYILLHQSLYENDTVRKRHPYTAYFFAIITTASSYNLLIFNSALLIVIGRCTVV